MGFPPALWATGQGERGFGPFTMLFSYVAAANSLTERSAAVVAVSDGSLAAIGPWRLQSGSD